MVIWASDDGPETMSGMGQDFGAQSDSAPFRGEFPIRVVGKVQYERRVSFRGPDI